MVKKILKIVVLILIIIGIILGIKVTVKKQSPKLTKKEAEANVFNRIQTKSADVTNFYTYGKAFNISGKISNISKDNFESAKLVITDGLDYEKEYNLEVTFQENYLLFESNNEINNGIIIDDLNSCEYYLLLRLKLNNSYEPKYYYFKNISASNNIDYYTVTKDGKNRKAEIKFNNKNYNNKEYNMLTISLTESELPEEVYDFVIDAGHGGKDIGENAGKITEADVTLEYAKLLKNSLEKSGFKVKLTRDDNNTDSFTSTNMYDSNGRISIACKSKAKLMISLHINQGVANLRGLEIYAPTKANIEFASSMANKIQENTSIEFSNNNSFKKAEGVYVRGFTSSIIKEMASIANKKGYEPYAITNDITYHYTIREVGGIATKAYVDGRNHEYSKNEYYNSNQGVECYQIELGYIKNDLNTIVNEKDSFVSAITNSIENEY